MREQSTLREALACLDSFTKSMASNLESADWSTRREILRTLIDRVLIESDQVRIVYRVNFPLFAKKAEHKRPKSFALCWRRAGDPPHTTTACGSALGGSTKRSKLGP